MVASVIARSSAMSAVAEPFVPTTMDVYIGLPPVAISRRRVELGGVSYETILYDVRDDGVATVTLNTPDYRYALAAELLADVTDAFESARDDERVRCVVLTSSHEKVFSA